MNELARVLSAADLTRLSEFLYRRTGMMFGESKRYYIDRRIADRMSATGSDTFAAYFAVLNSTAAEAEQLINSFTVNETYFYREEHQLECLTNSLLPEIIQTKRPGDRIRIWSVPCSTGEEAYSIAIWLLENWKLVDAYNVEIVGSDIDTVALGDAAIGLYGKRALSRLPSAVRDTYFERHADEWRLIKDLRESVTLRPANLVDKQSMADQGRFDVVFCRNVLIYFDEASRSRAVDHLYDAMLPGAFVCLGHTESMNRISTRFEVARFPDAVVYRRGREV